MLVVSVMSVSGGLVPSTRSCGSSTLHSLLCCYRPQEFPQGDSTPAWVPSLPLYLTHPRTDQAEQVTGSI